MKRVKVPSHYRESQEARKERVRSGVMFRNSVITPKIRKAPKHKTRYTTEE